MTHNRKLAELAVEKGWEPIMPEGWVKLSNGFWRNPQTGQVLSPVEAWEYVYNQQDHEPSGLSFSLGGVNPNDPEAGFEVDFEESEASRMRREEEGKEVAEAIEARFNKRRGGFAITSSINGLFIDEPIGGELRPITKEEAEQKIREFFTER